MGRENMGLIKGRREVKGLILRIMKKKGYYESE